MEFYDYAYIDEKIIGMIEKNLPNVGEVLRTVEKRATGKSTSIISQSMEGGEGKMGLSSGLSQQSVEED